jgi:holo-[acyl-carrier protein] synthase
MTATATSILGIGHDLVDIADIDQQLGEPGSRFSALFSVRERRQAARKAQAKGDSPARHLAACWAGKECVVKAWTEALGERSFPLSLDGFEWSQIEILSNSKGCPAVVLGSQYERVLADSLDLNARVPRVRLSWRISLTHSAQLASGVAMLCVEDVKPI